jgi:hypothetical protein
MLSNEEKNRIRAEEVFREEVRRELASKKGGRVLTFLNSALGIWLLSTMVDVGRTSELGGKRKPKVVRCRNRHGFPRGP